MSSRKRVFIRLFKPILKNSDIIWNGKLIQNKACYREIIRQKRNDGSDRRGQPQCLSGEGLPLPGWPSYLSETMSSHRIRLHWFIGSSFILLFVFLLILRFGFIETGEGDWEKDRPLPVEIRADQETWMNIYQQERKIGYVHRQKFKTLEGYKILESVFMQINTMGMVQDIRFKTAGNLKPDLTLSSFDFELFSSLFRFKAQGILKGKVLTVSMTSGGGSEQTLNFPLKEDIHLSVGLLEILGGKDMKPGDSRTFTVFDPITATERAVKVLVVGDETILLMDREEEAKKVSVEFMGVSQFAWIGKDGAVLREEGPLGIRLEQVAKEDALQRIALLPGTDIVAFASIPSNRVISSVEQLTELKLTMAVPDEETLFLEGDRQSLQDSVLTIRKEPLSNLSSQSQTQKLTKEIKKYLEPTPLIQSDHPEIQAKVKEIVSPNDSEVVKARKLVAWVYENIEKRPVLSVPDALEILHLQAGDCNEHAVLLTALARSAGIPAQMEAGIVYQRGKFYYHAWNVLYLGSWVTVDATMGQFPADVTHIRLVRGMERQIDLIRVIGRMKIDILSTSK